MVKVVAIIQARLSSQRLPGKVLKDLNGHTLLERVVYRVRSASTVQEVWLATSVEPEDDLLEIHGKKLGVHIFRGMLDNVLQRYYDTASFSNADLIVRVTADNPLVEPRFIDQGVNVLLNNKVDYIRFEGIPYGTGIEVFTRQALNLAKELAETEYEREHVTPYILNHPEKFKIIRLLPIEEDLRHEDVRLTIDTMEDYVNMYKLFNDLEDKDAEATLEQAIYYKIRKE